ncbi:MAG: sulfotransferase [Sporichthyaceae bacterium]|nr:sulfotransferase [Sporichthyaceae bacterium]
MSLPQFLVVGAMKAGTTTLYQDLRRHPAVYLPEKELDSLVGADILTPRGRSRYEKLFEPADPGQLLGQVSSPYAKLPDSERVVEHAERVLGDEFKVIYLVRDPVDRVVSQHRHEWSRGRLRDPLDLAVHNTPRLLNYTRYTMQITPWVDLVGSDRVRVVPFERYVADRATVLDTIFSFIGVDGLSATLTGLDRAHNRTGHVPVASGRVGRLVRSRRYRSLVRPLVPERVRRLGARSLLSTDRPRAADPSPATVDLIIQETAPELPPLQDLCGDVQPLWDLTATRRRYLGD